jgi:hypothetical protein
VESLQVQDEPAAHVTSSMTTLAVQTTTPDTTAELLAIVQRENKKKGWRFIVAIGLILGLFIAGHYAVKLLLPRFPKPIFGLYYLAAAGLAAYFAPTRLQKRATKALAHCDDVRAVGPLAEALDKQDNATRDLAISALERLLPRVQAADADFLTDHQLDCLHKALTDDKARSLQPALLKAIGQIGDERFLETVEALARGEGEAKKRTAVRDSAEQCLPLLKERVNRQRAPRTLLRPAESASGADKEVLLRPAGNSSSVAPADLLRPAE